MGLKELLQQKENIRNKQVLLQKLDKFYSDLYRMCNLNHYDKEILFNVSHNKVEKYSTIEIYHFKIKSYFLNYDYHSTLHFFQANYNQKMFKECRNYYDQFDDFIDNCD